MRALFGLTVALLLLSAGCFGGGQDSPEPENEPERDDFEWIFQTLFSRINL
jgi:hypothetical protein